MFNKPPSGLPAIIRQGCKGFAFTNTLAYSPGRSVTKNAILGNCHQVVLPLATVPETIPTLDLTRQLAHAVLDLGLELTTVLA